MGGRRIFLHLVEMAVLDVADIIEEDKGGA